MKNPGPENPHDGSTLDDFLRVEGILEEVEAAALKRVTALEDADSRPEEQS
jgi:hypothetical protein